MTNVAVTARAEQMPNSDWLTNHRFPETATPTPA